jgi:hypothetical protein
VNIRTISIVINRTIIRCGNIDFKILAVPNLLTNPDNPHVVVSLPHHKWEHIVLVMVAAVVDRYAPPPDAQ